MTVSSDLSSGVQNFTPEAREVYGRDGKTYTVPPKPEPVTVDHETGEIAQTKPNRKPITDTARTGCTLPSFRHFVIVKSPLYAHGLHSTERSIGTRTITARPARVARDVLCRTALFVDHRSTRVGCTLPHQCPRP